MHSLDSAEMNPVEVTYSILKKGLVKYLSDRERCVCFVRCVAKLISIRNLLLAGRDRQAIHQLAVDAYFALVTVDNVCGAMIHSGINPFAVHR